MSDTSTIKASTFGRVVINKIPEVTSNLLSDSKIELVVPASKIRDVVQLVDEELSDALPESVFGVDLQNDLVKSIVGPATGVAGWRETRD